MQPPGSGLLQQASVEPDKHLSMHPALRANRVMGDKIHPLSPTGEVGFTGCDCLTTTNLLATPDSANFRRTRSSAFDFIDNMQSDIRHPTATDNSSAWLARRNGKNSMNGVACLLRRRVPGRDVSLASQIVLRSVSAASRFAGAGKRGCVAKSADGLRKRPEGARLRWCAKV